MKLEPLQRYTAGVDPGANTGVGIYDRKEGRIAFLTTTDFFGVADWLMRMVRISELQVVVEVPGTFLYRAREDAKDSQQIRDRKMLLTGGIRREAVLLAESLRRSGFEVKEVLPIRQEKWDARKFKLMTKCLRQTNEHERDACRLAMEYAYKRDIGVTNGKS